ncbi:nucleotidyl transferase AbiEii/AbiGii toxin family protein [Promineifilum sp.]|uniref:nucleotidyl transferase AbiEii/AbiGii toxin family protein n=1 Tax=Promineifilum sp. TaxID=2664178 RepID=UPI0035AE1D50
MVKFYETAITPSCQEALALLASHSFLEGFYLAGGTALALQIGHRLSTDLDWFSYKQTLLALEREEIVRTLSTDGQFQIVSEQDGMIYSRLIGTDVSFIFQQHPLLRETVHYKGAQLASPIDIGLMKLAAINSRGARRDFVDIYCLRHIISLEELLTLAPQKYANRPDFLSIAIRALTYFEDAEQQPMPQMYVEASWESVKAYCQTAARKLARGLSRLN